VVDRAIVAPPVESGHVGSHLVEEPHRNIAGHGGEGSDLDFEVKNLDFTPVGPCVTLRS
jgi:hypothetical protein